MPKVLVISHNIFSRSGNMGKTMMEFLQCVPAENLAQLYFHSEIPTVDCCHRYWRIKDTDMIHSALTRKAGFRQFSEKDIDVTAKKSRTDRGNVGRIYQLGRKRTPLIYFFRNILWKMGVWDSPELNLWIKEFHPDLIFFACGDYAFAYKIAYTLSVRYNIPILPWCCDDHYLGKRPSGLLYRWNHRNLMKWAHRVMSRSETILTISDRMARDYAKLFEKQTEILKISAKINVHEIPQSARTGIVYAGNLGVNRITPLVELAKRLKKEAIPGLEYIDVYSGEQNPKTLEKLIKDNGIRFHGAVPGKEIPNILENARYLLHVEAFDERSKLRTGYSLSTKIGECLSSGACIIAYGPKDISSMEYLNQNQAAVFSENIEEIINCLKEVENHEEIYQSYVNRAEKLVQEFHDKDKNDVIMKQLLKRISIPPHM